MSDQILFDIYTLVASRFFRCDLCGAMFLLTSQQDDDWISCDNCGSVYICENGKYIDEDEYEEGE
jgi:DNA-directed RNA polymerase subunit RPC12/RpoP